MGSVGPDYKRPWCDGDAPHAYAPDWVGIPLCSACVQLSLQEYANRAHVKHGCLQWILSIHAQGPNPPAWQEDIFLARISKFL